MWGSLYRASYGLHMLVEPSSGPVDRASWAPGARRSWRSRHHPAARNILGASGMTHQRQASDGLSGSGELLKDLLSRRFKADLEPIWP